MRRLFYDIETSPCLALVWRPGYKINVSYDNIIKDNAIICICYKFEGDKKVSYLQWDKGDDRKLIEDFIKILDSSDEAIAHNGDGFDLPWVRMRAIKHGLDMAWDYPSTDTLKLAKRRAGKGFNFNSNRLDALAKFLGVGEKLDTHYGLWKDIATPILLNEKPGAAYKKALKYMIKYCKVDVEVLERVWNKLAPYVPHKQNAAAVDGEYMWNCTHCGSGDVISRGVRYTTAGTKKHRMSCHKCNKKYQLANRTYLDWLQFKVDLQKVNSDIR